MSLHAPDRGDLVWLDFSPQTGHEQAGARPALTLSPKAYNAKTGLALFCPITSTSKGYPFEVALPPGLKIHGFVLSDQAKSLDWRIRKARSCGRVPDGILADVAAKLSTLFPAA